MTSELNPSVKGSDCRHPAARLLVHENDGNIYACPDCFAQFHPGCAAPGARPDDLTVLVPGRLSLIPPPAPLTISEEELWGK